MVDIKYQNALTEVEQILKYTQEELVCKIPKSVRSFIKENKNQNYLTSVISNKSLEEQEILPETQAILALFYRSYWASEEEKQEFAKQDAIELEKKNKTVDEILKKEPIEDKKMTQNVTTVALINTETWYQKILKKIYNLFQKNTRQK